MRTVTRERDMNLSGPHRIVTTYLLAGVLLVLAVGCDDESGADPQPDDRTVETQPEAVEPSGQNEEEEQTDDTAAPTLPTHDEQVQVVPFEGVGSIVSRMAIRPTYPQREAVVEIELDDSALKYFHAVCGDDAQMATNEQLRNVDAANLPTCPWVDESREEGGPFQLVGGYVGDFSGDDQSDALLKVRDLSQPGERWQWRTMVLQRRDDGWEKTYVSTPEAGLGDCQPIQTPRRDWLVCSSGFVRQGYYSETRGLNYIEGGEPAFEAVTELADHTGACAFDGEFIRTAKVERIGDLTGDGNVEMVFGIETERGEPAEGFDPDDGEGDRCDEDNYEIETAKRFESFRVADDGVSEIDPADVVDHLDASKWAPFVD